LADLKKAVGQAGSKIDGATTTIVATTIVAPLVVAGVAYAITYLSLAYWPHG
tara:strand:+ start:1657 stop:1812 length:156 start_codon:yes stop_codon:yes gene_type:complete